MNTIQNGNTFGFDAARALAAYQPFAAGTPGCSLAVISERELPDAARTALASSAEKLGFGRAGVFWITCTDAEGRTLAPGELHELLVALDPLGFVMADAAAAARMEGAFDATCARDAAGRVAGRTAVAFESFTDMLASSEEKQRAWALLKRLA